VSVWEIKRLFEQVGPVLLGLVVLGIFFGRGRGRSSAVYVIKSWAATPTPPNPDGSYVSIVGRRGGIVSWVLSLIGVDPTVKFTVGSHSLVFEEGSWSGHKRVMIPIRCVTSVHSGYTRPWLPAVIVALVVGAVVAAIVEGVLFGGLMGLVLGIAYYVVNKTLELTVREGGALTGFAFKRSVIEGRNIDESQAEHVVQILQALIDTRR
jgi:hypothetical protein